MSYTARRALSRGEVFSFELLALCPLLLRGEREERRAAEVLAELLRIHLPLLWRGGPPAPAFPLGRPAGAAGAGGAPAGAPGGAATLPAAGAVKWGRSSGCARAPSSFASQSEKVGLASSAVRLPISHPYTSWMDAATASSVTPAPRSASRRSRLSIWRSSSTIRAAVPDVFCTSPSRSTTRLPYAPPSLCAASMRLFRASTCRWCSAVLPSSLDLGTTSSISTLQWGQLYGMFTPRSRGPA